MYCCVQQGIIQVEHCACKLYHICGEPTVVGGGKAKGYRGSRRMSVRMVACRHTPAPMCGNIRMYHVLSRVLALRNRNPPSRGDSKAEANGSIKDPKLDPCLCYFAVIPDESWMIKPTFVELCRVQGNNISIEQYRSLLRSVRPMNNVSERFEGPRSSNIYSCGM